MCSDIDVFMCLMQQVVSLLGLTEKAAVKVLAQLNELRDRTAKRVKCV